MKRNISADQDINMQNIRNLDIRLLVSGILMFWFTAR